jgi:hypothetical protein
MEEEEGGGRRREGATTTTTTTTTITVSNLEHVYTNIKHDSGDYDDDDVNSEEDTTSFDSAGSTESSHKGPNQASSSVPAFMSNISAPSFAALSFSAPSFQMPTSFGSGQSGESPSSPAFGSHSAATIFGAAPESKVESGTKTLCHIDPSIWVRYFCPNLWI